MDLKNIGRDMKEGGLPVPFVERVLELARANEGVQDLVHLWAEAPPNGKQRAALEADLQEEIDDREPGASGPRIQSHDDVDALLEQRKGLKARLRNLVATHGGVSEVARRAGMPQPSLSRLLSSMSETRPGTLSRLAPVLGVSIEDLVDPKPALGITVFRAPLYVGRVRMKGRVRYKVAAGLLEAS